MSKPAKQTEGERLRIQRAILRGDASEATRTKRSKQQAKEHKEQAVKAARIQMARERHQLEQALARKTKQEQELLAAGVKPKPERPVQYIHFVSGGRCSPK